MTGPTQEELDAGKTAGDLKKKPSNVQKHCQVLRVSNNSLFPAKVHFGMRSAMFPPAGPGVKGGPEANAPPFPRGSLAESPFFVDKADEEVFLEVDETTEVKVWCFPTQTGGVEPLGRDGLLKSR